MILLAGQPVVDYEQKAREYGATAVLDKSHEFMRVAEIARNLSNPTTRQH